MSTTTLFVTISSQTCWKCGAVYGLNDTFIERAQREGSSWNCPHCQSSTVFRENETDRLKRDLARLQTQIEHKDAEIRDQAARRVHAEHTCRAVRGVVTRIKNRVGAGVCPCCNRTFQSLARHMQCKHPDYRKEEQ